MMQKSAQAASARARELGLEQVLGEDERGEHRHVLDPLPGPKLHPEAPSPVSGVSLGRARRARGPRLPSRERGHDRGMLDGGLWRAHMPPRWPRKRSNSTRATSRTQIRARTPARAHAVTTARERRHSQIQRRCCPGIGRVDAQQGHEGQMESRVAEGCRHAPSVTKTRRMPTNRWKRLHEVSAGEGDAETRQAAEDRDDVGAADHQGRPEDDCRGPAWP